MGQAKSKSIKSGLFYNGLYQIISMVAPLITSPYISRVLGVDGYGLFNYTVSIAYYFFIFAMLGVNTYGNREIAKVRDDISKRSDVFWQIYYMQLFLGLLSTIIYLIFVKFAISENKIYFYLQSLYLLSICTDINWFAFGMEEFKFITIRNIVVKLLSTICIFVFVKSDSDLISYYLIYVLGVLLALLPIWSLVIKATDFRKPIVKEMLYHLKPNFILFLPFIASSLYQQMDKIMLGSLVSTSEVGYYNYSENILSIPLSLMTAVTNVMLPRSSYLVCNGKNEESNHLLDLSLKYTLIMNVGITFGILSVADEFIPWYLGDDYSYSAMLLKLLSPIVVISGVSTIVRNQLLIPNNSDKKYTLAIVFGAVANLLANYFMIGPFKAIGASVATIIASLVVMLLQVVFTIKKYNYGLFAIKCIPYLCFGFVMFIINCIVKNGLDFLPKILIIILMVLTGSIIYISLSLIYLVCLVKDPVIINSKHFQRIKKGK